MFILHKEFKDRKLVRLARASNHIWVSDHVSEAIVFFATHGVAICIRDGFGIAVVHAIVCSIIDITPRFRPGESNLTLRLDSSFRSVFSIESSIEGCRERIAISWVIDRYRSLRKPVYQI